MIKLNDQVHASTKSEWTAVMEQAHDRRCQVLKRIRLRLQMVEVAEKNSGLLACQKVVQDSLLALYPLAVTRLPYAELTAVIQGFIYDLNTKLTEDDIDNLGIGSDISTLEVANNEFVTAYNSRSEERAALGTGITQALRSQMLDLYGFISFGVQFRANDRSTETAAKKKATACQQLIAVMNEVLRDVKQRFQIRRKHSGEAEAEEGTETGGGNSTSGGNTNTSGSSNTGSNTGGSSSDDNHVEF